MTNIFIGHYDFILEELLRRVDIGMALVEGRRSRSKVTELCRARNIPVVPVSCYKDIAEAVKNIGPVDLCFVASFGIILKDGLIKKCRHIINFHPGDIECCRGRHPLPCAILNAHKMMGVTAHLIDSEEVDSGPIIAKTLVPIDYSMGYAYNEERLMRAARELSASVIDGYKRSGRFVARRWDTERSAYFKPLDKDVIDKVIGSKNLQEFAIEKGRD